MIEAWVTTPAGTLLAVLDRSESSPFRRFAVGRVLRDVSVGSLEYGLPNALLEATPTLFDDGNLVWMRYRGKTTTWMIEERSDVVDASEDSSRWVKLQGRTARQLVGDRAAWPTDFTDPPTDPSTWSTQWRSFVNRAAGEMLWDLIDESNPRFEAQLVRGTVETTGADGWTQDLRFDNLLDVVDAVEGAYGGDVLFDGLTFNYYASLGTDRSSSVIFEEGEDLLNLTRDQSDRDTATWIVGEGVGEGVFAKLAVAKDSTAARRREAYLDAKDAGNAPLLQLLTDGALQENGRRDAVGFEATEERFRVFEDYDLGDTVRAIAPSRGADVTKRVVGIYLSEGDDDRIHVELDLEELTIDQVVKLTDEQRTTARSLSRVVRQPQGQLVPFGFSGAGVFDENDTLETHFWIPERMYVEIECKASIDFRPYFAPATAAASGGGSTSSETSLKLGFGSQDPHTHSDPQGGNTGLGAGVATFVTSIDPHHHTTPNHTHGLTFGVYKEAYPASHSVTLKVYELVAGTWTLRGTITGLTADSEEVDLTAYVDGPGKWRVDLVSASGQPNGGRLAAYVSGYVLGAIQSA